MIEALLLVVALLGAGVAAYTDITRGIIPNAITLPLILVGLLGNLALGISSGNFSSFYSALLGTTAIFAVGYILWLLGGLSAADAKEYMFIAALVPSYPRALLGVLDPVISPSYPFIFAVFFDTFLAIFPFVMAFSLYRAWRKGLLSKILTPIGELKEILESAFVITAVLLFSSFLGLHALLKFLVLLLLFYIDRGKRLPIAGLMAVAYGIAGLLAESGAALEALGSTFFSVFAALFLLKFLWNSLRFLGGEALQEEKKVTELEEGDILAERICKRGKEIFRDTRDAKEKVSSALKHKGEKIEEVATTAARGVSEEEIEKLKQYVARGKLEDRIKIKRSIPFAPAILLGFLIALSFGDVFYRLAV